MEPGTASPASEADALLARFRATGDPAALGALFDATAPELFRVALATAPDAASAEDALQETFLAVIGAAARYDPSRRALPWLVGILRFKVDAVRRRRRTRRKRAGPRAATGRDVVAREAPRAGRAGEADRDEVARVQREIDGLEEPYRSVALLRWRYGLEPAEIAHVRGEPPGTTRSLLSRALSRLRRGLHALGVAWSGDAAVPRGLDGVRERVLGEAVRAAATAAVGTGAALVAGGFAMKKALWAAAALLALLGGFLVLRPSDESRDGDASGAPPREVGAAPLPGLAEGAKAPAGAQPVEAAPSAPVEVDPGGVEITGRVVDSGRRPVEGATVHVRFCDRRSQTCRSESDGRFRVRVGPRPAYDTWLPGTVFVEAPPASSGSLTASLAPRGGASQDVGTIAVGPGMPLHVLVTDGGRPVAGARVFARRVVHKDRNVLWEVDAESDADGAAALGPFPESVVEVLALADGSRRASVRVPWTAKSNDTLELALRPARTVTLSLVDASTDSPIEGARVELLRDVSDAVGHFSGWIPYDPPLAVAPTDAAGTTRIKGLGEDEVVVVRALAAGYSEPPGVNGSLGLGNGKMRVPAGVTEFRLALDRGRAVRWTVVAGECPVPPAGTSLKIAQIPGGVGLAFATTASGARMEEGEIVADGVPTTMGLNVLVVAPDGSRAQIAAYPGQERGMETSFRHPRTVDVVLRDEDGKPVAGMPVSLGEIAETAPTDDHGHVRFENLFGWRTQVRVVDGTSPPGELELGSVIGEVDLAKGDGRIEAVLSRSRTVHVRVRLDGESGLPSTFRLIVRGRTIHSIDEDPATGELRSAWRGAEGELPFSMSATGYVESRGTLREDSPGGPLTGEIGLVRAGSLLVRVVPPADGTYEIGAIPPPGGGAFQSYRSPQPVPGELDLWRIEGLRPGVWAVRDVLTGVAGGSADVRSGGPPAEVRLDLSRVGAVSGRVEVPDGMKPYEARVVVGGAGIEPHRPFGDGPGVHVGREGAFQVRIPGDRPVTISAWHATLRPAPDGGTVTLTAPQEGLVLRMVRGPEALFRPDPVPADSPLGRDSTIRAHLYRGEATGAPVASLKSSVTDGVARFGGFEPGTYTLFLDAYGLAPVLVRDVALGDGATDLGTIAFPKGGSIRVRVVVKDGQSPPRLDVEARAKTGPDHWRQTHSRGTPEVIVGGLGRGRYEVAVRTTSRDRTFLERIVESDGVGETVIDLDLR